MRSNLDKEQRLKLARSLIADVVLNYTKFSVEQLAKKYKVDKDIIKSAIYLARESGRISTFKS